MSNQYYTGLIQTALPVNPVWATLETYISCDNSVLDLKGSNHGTVVGATYVSDYLSFDGVNDYVSVIHNTGLTASDFTINIETNAVQNAIKVVIDMGLVPDTKWLSTWTGSIFRALIVGQADSGVISQNTWYMVTLTVALGGLTKLYVNGVFQNSITTPTYTNKGYVKNFGYLEGYGYYFEGFLRNYGYLNSAWTSSQVTEVWNSGTPLVYTP